MQGVSSRYVSALGEDHTPLVGFDVYDGDGKLLETIDSLSVMPTGGATCDSTAAVRRRLEATIVDTDGALVPAFATDLFSNESGNVIVPRRGILYPDGTSETSRLGHFDIAQSEADDSPDALTLKLTGYDQSRALQRAKLTAPYYVQEAQNFADAIQQFIVFCIGNRNPIFRFEGTSFVTPFLTLSEQADPLAEAQKMATAIGMELFLDVDGAWMLRTVPDPAVASVCWTYAEGTGATLLDATNTSSNERVYNGQIVVGDSSSGYAPARAEVWDTDPASPTYYLGNYGKVPMFTQDNRVLDDAQALAEATALFRQYKGFARIVTFDTIPNAAHDFLDVIRVRRARSRLDDTFMLDSWTVPLSPTEKMPVTTRERRT
jgi:hypothetical protein